MSIKEYLGLYNQPCRSACGLTARLVTFPFGMSAVSLYRLWQLGSLTDAIVRTYGRHMAWAQSVPFPSSPYLVPIFIAGHNARISEDDGYSRARDTVTRTTHVSTIQCGLSVFVT